MAFPYSRLICQTLVLLSLLDLPANASQFWVGEGRITEGVGQGGSVSLRLEIDGNVVNSIHGPHLNGTLQDGVIQTNIGKWNFRHCSKNLCVTFYRSRPRQTIFYRLHQSSRDIKE